MALHEIFDDTVKFGALVAKSRLANRQSPKVLRSLGDSLLLEYNGEASLLLKYQKRYVRRRRVQRQLMTTEHRK